MKKPITIILVQLFFFSFASSQSIIRSSVGSGGSSQSILVKGKTYFISQSIGQNSVIGFASTNGYGIRQGFQQPPYLLIISEPLAEENLITSIYPNPFSQTIKIAFAHPIDEDISIVLLDIVGRKILDKYYTPSQLIELSLEDIPSGQYLILLKTGERSMTTKIIKK